MAAKNSKKPKESTEKSSESVESTETKTETTTEEPTIQKKHDVTKDDWKNTNGPIFYSASKKLWYCNICELEIASGNNVGKHVRDIHGIQMKYAKEPESSTSESNESTESTEEVTEEGNGEVDRSSSSKFRKELFGPSIKYDRGIHDTGDLALQINIEEESKLVSQLIKNPYVTFLFAKLKDERKIYPDWTLADFLREGALYLCKKLGCEITFEFDIELLKQDKEFSQIALKINEAWEEFDAEMSLEKAGATIKV